MRFATAMLLAAQPRHLDLLLYLIHHHDRFVPRGELHDLFWPDLEWADQAIDSCLAGARKLIRGSTAAIRSSYERAGSSPLMCAPPSVRA